MRHFDSDCIAELCKLSAPMKQQSCISGSGYAHEHQSFSYCPLAHFDALRAAGEQ